MNEVVFLNKTSPESTGYPETMKLKDSFKEIANLFEVTAAPSYKSGSNNSKQQAVVENEDDSLVFEQEDLSLMESDFLLDNLKLENNISANDNEQFHDVDEHGIKTEKDDEIHDEIHEKALKLKLSSSLISSSNALMNLNSFLFAILNVLIIISLLI